MSTGDGRGDGDAEAATMPAGSLETEPHDTERELAARARSVSVGPGTTIGRYEIAARLGAGGMGVVYRARDPRLDREVALKLVTPADADLAVARARLEREAQAMAKLSHPNVCAVHDIGTWRGQIYIAMELCPGGGLGAWMRADRRPWREVVDRFMAAGRGLVAAHKLGFVHRDFKPDNVLVGRDDVIKVCDFGLVRSVARASADGATPHATPGGTVPDVSVAGAMVGTPAYMSPEQIAGQPAVPASDQFSFAVSVWEGLAGARPFQPRKGAPDPAKSLLDTISWVEVPTYPDVPGVPRRVWKALERALSLKVEDRWPSMVALLDELEAAIAPPVPVPAPRRSRVLVAALAGVTLVAAGVVTIVVVRRDDGESGAAAGRRLAGDADELYAKGDAFTAADVLFQAYTRSKDPVYLRRIADEWAHRNSCKLAIPAYGRYREARHPLPDTEDQYIRVYEEGCRSIAGPKAAPPVDEGVLSASARAKEAAGDLEGAVVELEAALEVKDEPVYLYEIGNLYRRHGRCSDARREYDWYVERVPSPPAAHRAWMDTLATDCVQVELPDADPYAR